MKKITLSMICLVLTMAQATAQTTDAAGAKNLLQEVVKIFNDDAGIAMDLEMKAAVGGTHKFRMMHHSDRSKMTEKDEVIYIYNQMMWVCDMDRHNIIISNKYRDESKTMASMAFIPASFRGEGKVVDDKTFQIGKSTFTYKAGKKDVEYETQQGKSVVTLTIDLSTRMISKLKVKQPMMSVTMNYSNVTSGCSAKEVEFVLDDYRDFRIIDER